MIPSKILAPILASVAFVAGAAVALPTLVAGDEPAPQREPLILEEAAQTAEPQPTLRPKPRDNDGGGPRQGPTTPPDDGDDGGQDDQDDVSDSDDDDDDDVEVVRPQPDDDDDDDEADDDGDDGDDD
ncbi:hypothetical protein G7072_05905 [Nocardioides sp. HDW12B]|uniref:hypothetical protein n=1 Tax=Nocardioides sp. HDW12B TaxID=2714939 RepID=UPI00140ACCAC|nr:hypothetical protein [Nocardioides sp. HDW12B]QIK65932.1 hypothetical protein G7072_05905 [Nocardioides sp. HDW12B]